MLPAGLTSMSARMSLLDVNRIQVARVPGNQRRSENFRLSSVSRKEKDESLRTKTYTDDD